MAMESSLNAADSAYLKNGVERETLSTSSPKASSSEGGAAELALTTGQGLASPSLTENSRGLHRIGARGAALRERMKLSAVLNSKEQQTHLEFTVVPLWFHFCESLNCTVLRLDSSSEWRVSIHNDNKANEAQIYDAVGSLGSQEGLGRREAKVQSQRL
ncbi:hypothetical protein K438DRAFT_1789802 [Mycena galopus ATCC 62051]|nr:hypothetical protein K438DRAFT_1789802 [Mycena galopus ATCC 62051]